MNTDFIVPLETKLDAEEKTLMVALCIKLYDKPLMHSYNFQDMHKTYRQENGKRESVSKRGFPLTMVEPLLPIVHSH